MNSTSHARSISIFLPNLEGGGAERMMYNIAEEFSRSGIDCELVLGMKHGDYLCQVDSIVRIVDLKSQNPFFVLMSLFRYICQRRPDILLSAMTNPNCLCILGALPFSKTKVIISERTTLSVQSRFSNRIAERIKPILARLFYRFADGYIAISQGVAEDISRIAKIKKDHINTIYNPVIDRRVKALISSAQSINTTSSRPLIIGVGRLVIQKDFETMIYAFAKVRENIDADLVILGKGPLQEDLKALCERLGVSENVSFPGFDSNPYKHMVHASVFVLSSKWEGFGNVLVEALACGIQIVSTDCKSGPAEILDNGRYGYLVPVGDALRMADAIIEAIDNPVDSVKLQTRADEFSSDKIASQYLDVIDTICGV